MNRSIQVNKKRVMLEIESGITKVVMMMLNDPSLPKLQPKTIIMGNTSEETQYRCIQY